ncbi:MAG: ABC transporter ATP-binding protein [Armatimonadota bacterium]
MAQAHDEDVLGKAFDADLTRKALVFLHPYKKQLLLALITMIITSATGLVTPKLTKIAVDDGMTKGNMRVLTTVAIIYVGTYLLRWIMQYWQTMLVSILGQHVVFDMRQKLFSHIQHLSLDFFDKREVGRIIARLTSDVGALNALLTSGTLSLVTDVLTMVGIIVLMVRESLSLALLTFAVMPLMGFITYIFRGKSRQAYRDVRRKVATVTATVAENVSGVKVVKSFSREGENLRRFKKVNLESREAWVHAAVISAVFHPTIELISWIGVVGIYWYGGLRVMEGQLSLGLLLEFVGYMGLFFMPIRNISALYQTMQGAMAGAERIFDILDTEPTIKDSNNAYELPKIEGNVEFEHVNFAYGEDPILTDVSFTVNPGETIALVGPTGAGKTTITSLLCRQYDARGGKIMVDGHDITQVSMDSLRSQIGVVLQDSFLFPGSVMENIRYGRLDATDLEVEAAAKVVGAHEFITQMPKGYDTDVREGGSNLSSGQKQLVSFARALLADPRILILDEATSSVDTYTELLIQEALRKLFKGRTSFVIAHRLSTIAEADRIMVIQGGKIAESGKHEELLAHDGIYRMLYDMQFADNKTEPDEVTADA